MRNWKNTIEDILAVPVPPDTDSYTAIPHSVFVDEIKQEVFNRGYTITDERYLTARDGKVLSVIYRIGSDIDDEICPSITGVNSYDKTRTAMILVSAWVLACRNGMMGTVNHGYYSRKHTGNALEDFREHIKTVVGSLEEEFKRLVTNKEEMKLIILDKATRAALVGDMFINEKLINPTQLNILKKEIQKPSCFKGQTLWDFYNHCTEAFKENHPSRFDLQHVKFHTYIVDKFQLTGSRGLFDPLVVAPQISEGIAKDEFVNDFGEIETLEDLNRFDINNDIWQEKKV